MKNFVASLQAFTTEWAVNILILLFGTTVVAQPFIVPTPSMDRTVMVGDHLIVDKLSYAPADGFSRHLLPYSEPRRGDIIVFRWPIKIDENYVKRCLGVPGDHIRIVDKDVYLNGRKLEEPYVQHVSSGFEPYRDNFPAEPFGPVYERAREMLAADVVDSELVVPEGQYFAMGDNRDNSSDSRYWGLVPRENIIGKPVVIFWSYDAPTEDWMSYSPAHFIDVAENFFSKTRWQRTLKLVRGYPIP
jgi:signal peptidase I